MRVPSLAGSAFERGVRAGATAGGLVIVYHYTIWGPTTDIRVRLQLLLFASAVGVLFGFLVFVTLGWIVLYMMGGAPLKSIWGLCASSVVTLLFLGSGIPDRIIPEFRTPTTRWIVLGLALVAAFLSVIRQRRHSLAGNEAHDGGEPGSS